MAAAAPFFSLEAGGYLNKRGLQAVASQVSRINVHAGLHYHIKQIRRLHPNVDVILIEPKPDDCQMFYYNIMRYSARLMLAQHGFESVTVDLAADYYGMKETLARHGVPINRRLVIDELADIRESGNAPEVIRNVIEKRSRSGVSGDGVAGELDRALSRLEWALEDLQVDEGQFPRAA